MTSIQERVEAGAAWLDANRPGWVDEIELDALDLWHCANCVLGQLFGDYFEAPAEARFGSAMSLGFDLPGLIGRAGYAELTQAWRDYITARRAAA